MLKTMNSRIFILFVLSISFFVSCTGGSSGENVIILSPDGRVKVSIRTSDTLRYSVTYDGDTIVKPSAIAMAFEDGRTLGLCSGDFRLRTGKASEDIEAPFYRQKELSAQWNYAEFEYEDWKIAFRVYDEGMAWRFETAFDEDVTVKGETAEFLFPGDPAAWVPYSNGSDPYANAFQSEYTCERVSEFGSVSPIALTPTAVRNDDGVCVLIGESDLRSYPGMFLKGTEGGYAADFAKLPDSTFIREKPRHQKVVATRQDIIARTEGTRTYPWRIVAIADNEKNLPVNNLVYLLAEPRRYDDISWVKPGQAAWEWWNGYGIEGKGFTPGVNTATYKVYIDFAAKYGIPYIIVDEGWTETDDIMKIKEAMDLEEVVGYGKTKNVGVFVWAVANVLDDKLEEACRFYSEMGVKGFKVDFFDRDDQDCMDMIYRIAETTEKYRLMLDLHGVNKPAGLNRTFPHVVNFEGVFGLEELKWSAPDMPTYDVTFPFLRQVQGPVDYTQGAFKNSTAGDFKIDYWRPGSLGTRAHQVAAYIVFDSPVVMLCDSPVRYEAEPQCTEFITSIPTVFDWTEILDGKIGEYIVTLREKDGTWYVGAMTGWDEREVGIRLDFLPEGRKYIVRELSDTASDTPQEYVMDEYEADSRSEIRLGLASGGGAALIITPKP